MDLQAQLQAIQDKLDAREAGLDKREQEVSDKQDELSALTDDLSAREEALKSREEAVAQIENVDALRQEITDTTLQLAQKNDELQDKVTVNKQKENDLVAVKAELDQREAVLIAREQAVSDKEQTYKQTVRDEFFAEVAKRLPQ